MRWRRGPLENGVFSEIAEMANERQNCQIINKNSNEMAKGRGPSESGDFGETGVFGENGD